MRLCAALTCVLLLSCGSEVVPNQPPKADPGPERTTRPGVEIELSGAQSSDPDGEITEYGWTFGDGGSAEGKVVTHAYTEAGVYAVTLVVTDDAGAEDTAATRVTVVREGGANVPPTAMVEGPARGAPGQTLNFSGDGSTDDGQIVEYTWDFGDGAMGSGAVVEHAFASEGQFVVTLTVVDDEAEASSASLSVFIQTDPTNMPPVANAGADLQADIGETVTLDGRGSTDSDGNIVSYHWAFGDGGEDAVPVAMHAFSQAGEYTAVLTVEDDGGLTDTDQVVVTVRPPQSYDGTWLLNPATTSETCDNSHKTYIIAFPAPQLDLSGTLSASVMGQAMGRSMMGTIDRLQSPPTVSLTWNGTDTDAVCGSATVEHRLNASFSAADRMTEGRFTVLYTWTDPFCSCVRTFDFTGAKQ